MHLTLHTDYGLRVLLYLCHFPDRRVGTQEISEAYGISKHHLVRVVQTLAHNKLVTASTGRGGGIELARRPEEIRLGEVVRVCEPGFRLVECFEPESNTCPITSACKLQALLGAALKAFFVELDRHTLADLAHPASARKLSDLLWPAAATR